MKNLKKLILSAAMVIVGMVSVNAQTQSPENKAKPGQKGGSDLETLNLTDAQKAQMKANRENAKAANEKFRASLSEEQKAMMGEKGKSLKENREKFEASLTAEQKAILKAKKQAEKKNQEAFVATLSAEQKAKFEEMKERRGDVMGQGGSRKHKLGEKSEN